MWAQCMFISGSFGSHSAPYCGYLLGLTLTVYGKEAIAGFSTSE